MRVSRREVNTWFGEYSSHMKNDHLVFIRDDYC